MREPLKLALISMGSAVAMAALLLGVHALADGLQQTDQVLRHLAYHGELEKDGAAVDGIIQMTFRLYDGATATEPAWVEFQEIDVRVGRFSALLGSASADSVAALTATVEAADDLYMEVTILDGQTPVLLDHRQRFVPLPYSHWTSVATNLSVDKVDGLENGGTLLLNEASKAPVQVGGQLELRGDLEYLYHPNKGNGGKALSYGAEETLIINPNGEMNGGTIIEGDLITSPTLVGLHRRSGNSSVLETYKSIHDWTCIIGAVEITTSVLDTSGSDNDILEAYTYRDFGTETWKIKINLKTQQIEEHREVGYVCIQKGLTEIVDWW